MTKRRDIQYWNIPVTPHLNKLVEKAVDLNAHVSKAELIRDAVREKLANMGLKEELETIVQQGLVQQEEEGEAT